MDCAWKNMWKILNRIKILNILLTPTLRKDYKVHIPVVKELLSEKYDVLAGIKCVSFREKSNQQLLLDINSFLG